MHEAGRSLVGKLRGDVDDAAPAASAHAGRRELGELEQRPEVHRQHPIECRKVEPLESDLAPDPGIVDENIDGPEIALRACPKLSYRVGVRDVASFRMGRAPHRRYFGHDAVRVVIAVVADDHIGAFRGEGERDRSADAAAAAGDQRNLAFETPAHHVTYPGREATQASAWTASETRNS